MVVWILMTYVAALFIAVMFGTVRGVSGLTVLAMAALTLGAAIMAIGALIRQPPHRDPPH